MAERQAQWQGSADMRLDFIVQSTVNLGTANNVSFDLNGLIGTTGGAVVGCSAVTQLTGTLGCSSGAFVSGIFATTARQSSVPEPATLSTIGGSLIGLFLLSRRRNRTVVPKTTDLK